MGGGWLSLPTILSFYVVTSWGWLIKLSKLLYQYANTGNALDIAQLSDRIIMSYWHLSNLPAKPLYDQHMIIFTIEYITT